MLFQVPKCVYEKGAGKIIPLTEVISQRQKERGNAVVIAKDKLTKDNNFDTELASKKLGMPGGFWSNVKICGD